MGKPNKVPKSLSVNVISPKGKWKVLVSGCYLSANVEILILQAYWYKQETKEYWYEQKIKEYRDD